MTEAALTHTAATGAAASATEATGVDSGPAPSFPDLVWAHFQWDTQRRDGSVDPDVEQRYRRTLAEFEAKHGELISAYWSRADASAVAVTAKPLGPLHFNDWDVTFHRATDWVTRSCPAIPDVLNDAETLAMKAHEVLRHTSKRIAIQWVYSVAAHVLGSIERSGGKLSANDARLVAHEADLDLDKVEVYYDRAGTKAGRIVYAQGMIVGAAFLVVWAVLSALALWLFGAFDTHSKGIQFFFACYASGALGAIVSVLSRMASARSEFVVDYEVGRPALRFLGSFRPFVGAIFGLATYFAVKSGLLQVKPNDAKISFYWFTVLSFFGGFSERFTKVLIDSAERVLPGDAKKQQRRQSGRTGPPPEPPAGHGDTPPAAQPG